MQDNRSTIHSEVGDRLQMLDKATQDMIARGVLAGNIQRINAYLTMAVANEKLKAEAAAAAGAGSG